MAVWPVCVLIGVVWVFSLVRPGAAFDTSCQDIPAEPSVLAHGFPAVVAVHTTGRATGTYRDLQNSGITWRLGNGEFTITGRGFVVGQFVVTAAHVLYPAKLELRHEEATTVSQVIAVDQTVIHIGAPAEHGGIPAEVVHINHRFDLAILRPQTPALLQSLPYRIAATWWYETPGEVSSVLRTGDCVVAMVPERDTEHTTLTGSQRRAGQVVAPNAFSSQSSVVQGLNANTVTISTLMFPGDSGSPVIAFEAGTPRLVGMVIATRYPFETTSYISRLDPLLPILEALHAAQQSGTRLAQVQ
jgi:hypothetical protein